MVLFPASEWIRTNLPDAAYRMTAGAILGSYGVFGYAMAVHLYNAARSGQLLQAIDGNKWTRPFSVLLMLFLIALSVVTWYVAWEGKNTGKFYGLGVLIAGTIAEMGIGSILKRTR